MEDRFTAIRFAIAAALPRDVVVIAGKGAEEFQEYCEEDTVVKVQDSACCPPLAHVINFRLDVRGKMEVKGLLPWGSCGLCLVTTPQQPTDMVRGEVDC